MTLEDVYKDQTKFENAIKMYLLNNVKDLDLKKINIKIEQTEGFEGGKSIVVTIEGLPDSQEVINLKEKLDGTNKLAQKKIMSTIIKTYKSSDTLTFEQKLNVTRDFKLRLNILSKVYSQFRDCIINPLSEKNKAKCKGIDADNLNLLNIEDPPSNNNNYAFSRKSLMYLPNTDENMAFYIKFNNYLKEKVTVSL